MQHYGYRSFFIDVTSDPEVALWFALHRFESKRAPIYVGNQLRSAVFQMSQYIPNPSGFVYSILTPPENESGHRYFDLSRVMPIEARRVHRQRAGAIFCEPKSRSIGDLVVAKMRIVDHGWFSNSSQDFRTAELFPPPSIDAFYRCLCTLPYFTSVEAERLNIRVGHPLLGFFPIYAESLKNLVLEYVPLTRILSGATPGLELNAATTIVENQRIEVRDATRVSLSSLMVQKVSQDVRGSKKLQTDCWPSPNLLLEFVPETSLAGPPCQALKEVVRGLWVAIGTKSIVIAEIVDRFDDILIGHECSYSLPELSLVSRKCDCPDHAYELEIFRKASELLNRGIASLERDKLGYLKLECKEDNRKLLKPKQKPCRR
jgi:hypothetical protein